MAHPAQPLQGHPASSPPWPRDDELAEVIRLDAHRRVAPGTYLRRRVAVGLALILLVALAIVGAGRLAAMADPADPVAGHDVVHPGETLWDVATEHAPAGSDPRSYLGELIELNGFDGSSVPAWTVVLLPRS